jgi:hypothetical protein
MRIIHGGGYSEADRVEFIPVVYLNTVRSMQACFTTHVGSQHTVQAQ